MQQSPSRADDADTERAKKLPKSAGNFDAGRISKGGLECAKREP
jgi:hypothetical protein